MWMQRKRRREFQLFYCRMPITTMIFKNECNIRQPIMLQWKYSRKWQNGDLNENEMETERHRMLSINTYLRIPTPFRRILYTHTTSRPVLKKSVRTANANAHVFTHMCSYRLCENIQNCTVLSGSYRSLYFHSLSSNIKIKHFHNES